MSMPRLNPCAYCGSPPTLGLQSELNDALSHEGAKDARIEALEAALDWAILAVFYHYESGEAPAVPGALDEIEKSRARFVSKCKELAASQSETGA
jgi:hypothetical protein